MSFDMHVVALVAICIVMISLILYVIVLFNNHIAMYNLILKSRSNIDVLLQQRFDELNKLIIVTKGYAKHESETLIALTKMRKDIMGSSITAKAGYDKMISVSLKSLFAVAERYPTLRADTEFLRLQRRISGIESQIAERREFYNATATNYNIWIESIPNNIIARLLRKKKVEMFMQDAIPSNKVDA